VRFVKLHHYLIKSIAYRTMPAAAKALLTQVWLRHNGENNGEISYGCGEAQEIGMSSPTASRMFDILADRGFLVVVRDSSFDAKNKMARTWRITAEPCGGKPATKDFMCWRPTPTKAGAENHFTVSPMKPDGFTHETMSPEKPVSVSPAKPSSPILAGSQFHQRNTYSIPCGGGEQQDSQLPYPLPGTWYPDQDAILEAVTEGLHPDRIAEAVKLFRQRYTGNDVQSTTAWLGLWRIFVRGIVNTQPSTRQ
jgi:hypothetical protein